MKTHIKVAMAVLPIFLFLSACNLLKPFAEAQSQVEMLHSKQASDPQGIKDVNIHDFSAFRKAVMPLIDAMANKKIVSLGEGTHGTHEFNKIRFWITKILVEERGFTHVAFENDYGDSYFMNEGLKNNHELVPLMKKHLIRIWQNQETEDMFKWMKSFNERGKRKVTFSGIDNMYVSSEAKLLRQLLAPVKDRELDSLSLRLLQHSLFQDSIWNHQNDTTFKFDVDELNKNGVNGYLTADELEKSIRHSKYAADLKQKAMAFLQDSKQGFNTFYQWNVFKRGSSRDSTMAEMAALIVQKKDAKLVIWAHNAHVAKSAIFGGVVGGAGGFIKKKFPGKYFVMGTGTAEGTFAAMTDNIVNYSNRLASYALETSPEDSWEKRLTSFHSPTFYALTTAINSANDTLKHRHVGYRENSSGKSSFDKTNLLDLYDSFFFIRKTSAAKFFK